MTESVGIDYCLAKNRGEPLLGAQECAAALAEW